MSVAEITLLNNNGKVKDWRKIAELEPYAGDASFRKAFDEVKQANKVDFAQWMARNRQVEINPDTIESINVLKNGDAVQKYGQKGRHGVIEITSKKQ